MVTTLAKDHIGVVIADLLEHDEAAPAESLGAKTMFRQLDVIKTNPVGTEQM